MHLYLEGFGLKLDCFSTSSAFAYGQKDVTGSYRVTNKALFIQQIAIWNIVFYMKMVRRRHAAASVVIAKSFSAYWSNISASISNGDRTVEVI